MNCLILSLLYWNDNRDCKIVYDGDHIITVFPPMSFEDKGFLDIREYGKEHMIKSFNLKRGWYKEILEEYFK